MTGEQKELILQLRAGGLGPAEISRRTDVPKNTVKSFLKRNSTPVSVPVKAEVQESADSCRECGRPIIQNPKTKQKIFCCDACRVKWWSKHRNELSRSASAVYTFKCRNCGRMFQAYGNSHRKYCSHACYIADRYGGGRDD